MGGKDAIIVDREADLDSAVKGVLWSAFGYQGQKCSACSRAIVDQAIYDQFLEKLRAEVAGLKVGPSDDPANYMGPVINAGAKRSILEYVEVGKKEGRLVAGGAAAPGDGYFVAPTVIADVDSKARIFQEEIFGPVLAVTKARDFDHALATRQRFRVRADGRGLHQESRKDPQGARSVLRRQSLHQSQMHRRDGGRASVRRIQHVGDGLQGRRAGLPAAVPAGQVDRRKDFVITSA